MFSTPAAFGIAVALVTCAGLMILFVVLYLDLRRRHRLAKYRIDVLRDERDTARRELADLSR